MKKVIKPIIGFIFLVISFYLFVYLNYKNKIFILIYHRISDYQGGLKSLYVSPTNFEKQMKFLYSRGYRTITLSELKVALLKNNREFLKKKFCITFDDGYEDILNAYPILKKYNYTATVYVHVNAVKSGYYVYPKMVTTKMINLKQLSEILDVFEIGSHTLSHPDLSKLSEREIFKELLDSKIFLEEKLNVKIKHFCYPFGKVFDNYSVVLKNAGYETAVVLKTGLVNVEDEIDFYKLPRIEWKEVDSMSIKDFIKNLDFYLKIFFAV